MRSSVIASRAYMVAGSRPSSPLRARSSAATRPSESAVTPYHSPGVWSVSHPSERVQRSPPTVSNSDRRVSRSIALQRTNCPCQLSSPSQLSSPWSQASKTGMPGTQRDSFPLILKFRRRSSCNKLRGTTPERLLFRSHRLLRLAKPPSSVGIGPDSSFQPRLSDSRLGKPAQWGRDRTGQSVRPEVQAISVG